MLRPLGPTKVGPYVSVSVRRRWLIETRVQGLRAEGCRRRAFGALASLAGARGRNRRAEAGGLG